MIVRLYCEGNYDGRIRDGEAECLGAAATLVKRIVDAKINGSCVVKSARLPKMNTASPPQKLKGYERRIAVAIDMEHESDIIVVLVDRDKPDFKDRLVDLKNGRESKQLSGAPLALKTAIGLAIEELEAWLISDKEVLESLALTSVRKIANPQSVAKPKEELHRVFKASKIANSDYAQLYDAIASKLELDDLSRSCPAFKDFKAEIEALLS
jgi:hypothetical protein